MEIIWIFLVSIISASFFDLLPILKTIGLVITLQKESLNVILDKEYSDEQKQKMSFSYACKIFNATIKLIIFFLITILPFFVLAFITNWFGDKTDYMEKFISVKGAFLTSTAFLCYYLIKMGYARFRL